MKERLGILLSGDGSTARVIIAETLVSRLKMDVACVVSSNPNAYGMKRARFLGISPDDIICLNPKNPEFSKKLLEVLQSRGVTVVTQNGWLAKTPENVIEAYKDKIFNQHPGPVPEFGGKGMYGKRVHLAVLLYRRLTGRDMWTEVIAQRVEKEYDRGVIVGRRRVPILPKDTVSDLQQRCLPVEHQVQIELLKHVTDNFVWEYPKHAEIPVYKNEKEQKLLEQCKKIALLDII